MKKIITLFLSLLLLCSMSMTAFANEATISTIVPDSHTITVTADDADVFCNGQSGNLFTVERLSEPTLLIRAASGKEITKIQLNGENITAKVEGGYYTLEPIYEDKTLTVETKDASAAQGETYTLQGTVKRNGQPVKDITMELRSTLKTDVTDKDGKFSFSDVECGKHSLTAIENGKIVGYVEFVLTEGSEVSMSLSDGVYTLTVNKNDIGINLTLNLSGDDTMNIESVTGIKTDEIKGDACIFQRGVVLFGITENASACSEPSQNLIRRPSSERAPPLPSLRLAKDFFPSPNISISPLCRR